MAKPWGMVKDPIHGYIHVSDLERQMMDTLPLQRLRRVKQLVFADYVYPGANHTRFEHSLGVMHLAGVLGRSLPAGLTEEEVEAARLAGLLHDVGHGPFSHTFEQVLVKRLNKTHEDLTTWIVKGTELKDILSRNGLDPDAVAELAVGKAASVPPYVNQIISSAVDVDKMDFLMRDTYHTGAQYGNIDVYRLIYTMEVFGGNLVVNSSALPALEAFLIARVESFRAIYYHKAARAAQIMLVKAMEAAEDEIGLCSFKTPQEYIEVDDYTAWSELKRCPKSRGMIKDLERRRLLKCAYEREVQAEDKSVSSLFGLESLRGQVEEELASMAGVPEGEVFIDTPSLPSIPYRHTIDFDPMEVPIVDGAGNERKLFKATKLSKTIEVLRGFVNIVRVYTYERNRERVRDAAERALGNLPESARVSY